MTAARVTMIGVGNLMEMIWPAISHSVGGDDVSSRLIGVTADAADIERKQTVFGFEMVLNDNLGALRKNHPDLIMFAPPPSIAPELIRSVLQPYYAERRQSGGTLPELLAFPPIPLGATYQEALGSDVLVANMIPNNVTTIAGTPIEDEGHYVCTYPAPWPESRKDALQSMFAGQGAYIEMEPHQLVPMLGGGCLISALWFAVPAVADLVGTDHNLLARYLRAELNTRDLDEGVLDLGHQGLPAPPNLDTLVSMIRSWHGGVEQYFRETDLAPSAVATLVARGFDLTLHTAQAEPRSVLSDLAVGAATKGGVLECGIRQTRSNLLPSIQAGLDEGAGPAWESQFSSLVTAAAHTVREHGATLAD
ncbi:MAG: hypothetical protein GY724_14290 [Actinomycetia bacterium]|nr:hypothetical protein [Actinomycetes bacterium]MCP5035074.1 hypothetical protein [Actinomycetes bacterium]